MGVKFKKKRLQKWTVAIIVVIGILKSVAGSAEGKALNRRKAIDYDEHFGFGLMNEEHYGGHGGHHLVDEFVDSSGSKDSKVTENKATDSSPVRSSGGGGTISGGGGGRKGGRENKSKNTTIEKFGIRVYPIDEDGVTFVGCYHRWLGNTMVFLNYGIDEDYTYKTCSAYCREKGHQISILKGMNCRCSHLDSFSLFRFNSEACNIPCPVSSVPTSLESNVVVHESCGGNQYFSVYCQTLTETGEDCFNLQRTTSRNINEIPVANGVQTVTPEPYLECAWCDGPASSCSISFMSPSYDYFPTNDPTSCISFCENPLRYGASADDKIRAATKYAILTWKQFDLSKPIILPICQCVNNVQKYIPADPINCPTRCPGDPDTKCGHSDVTGNPVYVSVYCANGPCGEDDVTTAGSVPTPGVTETVETSPLYTTSTRNPSTDLTTLFSSTTTKPTSPETTMSTLPPTTSTSVSTPTMPPDPIGVDCMLYCRRTDRHGNYWEVCAGSTGDRKCGHDSKGFVVWRCSYDGHFETEEPDYSDCHSSWVGDMEDQASKINDTASAVNYLTELKRTLQSNTTESTYFGHEIRNVTTILKQVVKKAENVTTNVSNFEEVITEVVDVTQHLITTTEPWFEIGHVLRSKVASDIIETIEDASISLTAKVNISSGFNNYEYDVFPQTSEYYVAAGAGLKLAGSPEDPMEFPATRSGRQTFIKLPKNWKNYLPGDKVEFVGMFMDAKFANLMMPGQFKHLGVDDTIRQHEVGHTVKIINSQLISFTLASSQSKKSNEPKNKGWTLVGDDMKLSIAFKDTWVEITFEHDLEAWGDEAVDIRRTLHPGETRKAALGTSQCVYWDPGNSIWSTDGCKLVSSTRFHTICQCNHLTSFAMLMDVHNYVGKDLGLEILTLILCSLSFICLFVSVMIFSTIRGVKNIRTTITKNLSVCLLVGNSLVLLVLDRHYLNMSDGLCIASGIISHYVFLSAFIWMAIEGLHLYKMVVHVFDTENNPLNQYRVISYGLPLIIVAITVVIGYLKGDRPYGGDVICWLDGPYIWSFMVPVALVVMVNFVILFIALKTAYQLQHNTHMPVLLQSRVRSLRTWIRGCFSITVLLGLTWLVGFFTLIPEAPGMAAAYIFTILNASQGVFIFVFHCFLNDKVRFVTSKRFGSYLPSWFSSSMNNNSSGSQGNDGSGFGKRSVSNMKTSNSDFQHNEKSTVNKSKTVGKIRDKLNFSAPSKNIVSMDTTGGTGGTKGRFGDSKRSPISVITPPATGPRPTNLLRRRESLGTVSSVDSLRPDPEPNYYSSGSLSDSGNNTDNSLRVLVSDKRHNSKC